MLWPKQTHKEKLLNGALSRARSRGLEFNITLDDIVIPTECPYLKVPMKKGGRYAPSLDRIDNSLGYVKGNVEVISRKANVMKNDASTSELLEFAYTILERN